MRESGRSSRRLVLFGASSRGREVLTALRDQAYNVVAIADNNDDLHGTVLEGIEVVAPGALPGLDFDQVVIASQWVRSISSQLLDMGIAGNRLATFGPTGITPLDVAGKSSSLPLSDEDFPFMDIWARCAPCTMTSFERGLALYRGVKHVVRRGLEGAFVECGVWRGGSSMIVMHTLLQLGITDRDIFLFDTFAGMSEPCEHDVDHRGRSARELLEQDREARTDSLMWAYSELEEVRRNVASTGYDMDRIHFVEGDVAETLPVMPTGPIALLRLDTDFYQSTRAELEILYPRLRRGGVLIIDDYGHWEGARKAVEEYFDTREDAVMRPLFHRIDYTGRMAVREDGFDA